MFSFAKKPAQEVVLQDLTEDQLTQVAGGNCSYSSKDNDHDADDKKKWEKKHHHHHHHHHHHYEGHHSSPSSKSCS